MSNHDISHKVDSLSPKVLSVVDRRTVEIPEEQVAARKNFGNAIRIWFRMNRWSQDVPHHFAKERDMSGPWNSQMSLLMSGKLDPKAQFWISLEEFNFAVSKQDLKDLDEGLVKRMTLKQPFITADGKDADAQAFYGMFIGRTKWDQRFDAEPLIGPDEAEKVGAALLRRCEDVMLDKLMTRAEFWERLSRHLEGQGNDNPNQVKRWLVGLDPYNPELHLMFGKGIDEALRGMK